MRQTHYTVCSMVSGRYFEDIANSFNVAVKLAQQIVSRETVDTVWILTHQGKKLSVGEAEQIMGMLA